MEEEIRKDRDKIQWNPIGLLRWNPNNSGKSRSTTKHETSTEIHNETNLRVEESLEEVWFVQTW